MSRLALQADLERPIGATRIVARSLFATAFGNDSLPFQHLVFLGGPTTGPGYDFHEFAARTGASQRLELHVPAPFPSFKLGRYGRTPATITLAPYVNAMWVNKRSVVRGLERLPLGVARPLGYQPPSDHPAGGWYPSVGVGALALFEVIRFDVARGLRDGRWSFYVDFGRDFWGIL
jgi:hypothetical protein